MFICYYIKEQERQREREREIKASSLSLFPFTTHTHTQRTSIREEEIFEIILHRCFHHDFRSDFNET